MTPYVVVAVNSKQVVVPQEFVKEGKIVLNVSPMAVRNLVFGDETFTFDGRFSGNPFTVSAPIARVLTIYAKETGEGMMFDGMESSRGSGSQVSAESDSATQTDGREPPDPAGSGSKGDGPGRPGSHLKVVK